MTLQEEMNELGQAFKNLVEEIKYNMIIKPVINYIIKYEQHTIYHRSQLRLQLLIPNEFSNLLSEDTYRSDRQL